MEVRRGATEKDTWAVKRRDKAEMAWRHKSSSEKNLIRLIGALVFCLSCFIIAVTVMDIAYKAKIKSLEDELNQMSRTTPQALTSTDVTDSTTDTSTIPTTVTVTSTTTVSTTTEGTTTTEKVTTTTYDPTTITATATDTEPTTKIDPQLIEALQSMLHQFGQSASAGHVDKAWRAGEVVTRTRGTFVILADLDHQQAHDATTPPDTPAPRLPPPPPRRQPTRRPIPQTKRPTPPTRRPSPPTKTPETTTERPWWKPDPSATESSLTSTIGYPETTTPFDAFVTATPAYEDITETEATVTSAPPKKSSDGENEEDWWWGKR